MVISAQLRAEIDEVSSRYPSARAGLLPALHRVQAAFGCVSHDAARELAEIFEIHPVEVMELVGFYPMFRREAGGRHRVGVCTNLSCSLRGARTLLAGLEAHLGIALGETSSDARVTLVREECLGACAGAPMMRIDELEHLELDLAETKRIVDGLE